MKKVKAVNNMRRYTLLSLMVVRLMMVSPMMTVVVASSMSSKAKRGQPIANAGVADVRVVYVLSRRDQTRKKWLVLLLRLNSEVCT